MLNKPIKCRICHQTIQIYDIKYTFQLQEHFRVTKKHINSICEQLIQNRYNNLRIHGIINYNKIIKHNIFTKLKHIIMLKMIYIYIYINKTVIYS